MNTCDGIVDCAVLLMPSAFDAVFAIIALASGVAALTPTPSDDSWLGKIYRIVDALALNVGYAKEKGRAQGGRFVAE